MEIRAHHTFNAPPAKVYQMMTDEGFLASLARRANPRSYDVQVALPNARVTLTLDAPAQLKRFFSGATVDGLIAFRWATPAEDGTRNGTFDISAGGLPAHLRGRIKISGTDTTAVDYLGDLKISIPIVGTKLEAQVGPRLEGLINLGQQVGNDWLAAQDQ